MKTGKRRHTPEFKATVALEAIRGKFSIAELAERFQVNPSLIHSWKKTILEGAEELMLAGTKGLNREEEVRKEKEKRIEKLEKENRWLQKVLQRMSSEERKAAVEAENPQVPLLRQAKLLDINRSTIYYRRRIEAEHMKEHKIAN